MSRFIDADRIDWRLITPTNATTAEENMIYQARKLVESQPTADVVPRETYRRLLEDAKIISDSFDEYLRRTGE